jgi:hypothetical protein
MKRIETRIKTDASPEEVWAVLMDFDSYPAWNPMIVRLEGEAKIGARLRNTILIKPGRQMTFKPTVVEYEPNRRFGWNGKLGPGGLFDGLHRFEVTPSDGGTTFVHSEEFRGLLPPLLGGVLRATHRAVLAMNEALVAEVARRKENVTEPETTVSR